jgi:predicted Zn-dependent protease
MNVRLAALSLATLSVIAQTPARQEALNRQIADDVRRHTTPVDSQEIQNYVAQLGARLAAQSPGVGSPFRFSVVSTENDDSLHEPLVVPGGDVFVPSRLLLAANDEAEFAGMLAQAIARGPVLLSNNATTITMTTVIGGFMPNTLLSSVAFRQWHDAEIPADKSAVLAMSRAGFDPVALLRFIDRMQRPDNPRSPFPPRGTRLAALREAISAIPPANYAANDEFYSMQNRVRPAPRSPPPSLLAK